MDPRADLSLRPDLLAAGWTDAELLRMRRAGLVTRVRGGAYLPADDERLARPEDRHRLLVRSTLPRLRPGAVVSHVSAAVLLGLPVWGVRLDRVHVSRPGTSGGRTSGRLRLHVGPLADDEVVDVGGIRVTSPATTVVALARTLPFEQAVVIADAALHGHLCGPAELERAHARAARRPGGPRARRVLAFADGRSDSVGESRSRCALRAAGLPPPVLQHVVRSARGRFLGKVDFAWPELGVVGEFDGMVKYGRNRGPGRSVTDAVVAEKVREDGIRGTGLWVVRWTWRDLDAFAPVADTLRARFARVR